MASPAFAADSGLEAYEVRTNAKGFEQLAQAGFDMTEARSGSTVEIIATRRQAAEVRKLGLAPRLKRDARGRSARQALDAAGRGDGTYDVYRPFFDDRYVGTVNADGSGGKRQTLLQELQALDAASPHAKLVEIGRSGQGKPIVALRVTKDADAAPTTDRPKVLYSAAQHAREWITPEMLRRLAHLYVDNYGRTGAAKGDKGQTLSAAAKAPTAERLTGLVDTRELWFVPVANPDGYDFSFTPGNRLWRKTTREQNGIPGTQTGDGVDPNRNFAENWGYDNEGSSPDPSSETYRGPGPNSEPETQAMDRLLRDGRFAFQVNYHSAAELLLYPFGFQVETETADDPIYEALSGTDAEPAIPGKSPEVPNPYDPDLAAELYTTNGETTDHAHSRHGTLAWTPEMDVANPERGAVGEEGGAPSVFEFQDSEGDLQAAFEKNVPFALDVADSADDPANPENHLGNTTPDFEVAEFGVSYGNPQTVEVNAKRSLGDVRIRYQVNGGPVRQGPTSEWEGGERFGAKGDVHYHRLRGTVRGTQPGDRVTVSFAAGEKRSKSFSYVVRRATGNPVLILAAEDYSGTPGSQSPAQPGGDQPAFLERYTQALDDAGIGYDVYDVDAEGRTAPDRLGVLSHYRAVLWYTGNDLFIREPGAVAGTGTSKLANDEILNVRAYLNDGGKLLYTGQHAAYGQLTAFSFNPAGQPPYCAPGGTVTNCVPLSNDFLQYYLGAYLHIDAVNDKETASASRLRFGDLPFALNGADSADNQEHVYSMVTTSSILPPAQFPLFRSEPVAAFDRPAAFDPITGQYYAVAESKNNAYQRLRRTVDLTGATSGELQFKFSYDTEVDYDYVFVEARTAGQDDWTTLPDANGNTTRETGSSCTDGWQSDHPQLLRYQTKTGDTCTPTGTTGEWHAASGNSAGFQDWKIDLSRYAGKQVELSITYATDPGVTTLGAFVDDVVVTKDGAEAERTSFEDGLGGFTAGPPPEGSDDNANWARRTSVGYEDGPGVATEDTVYFGFGLEGVSTAAQRTALVSGALARLGVTRRGPGGGGGGNGGGGGGTGGGGNSGGGGQDRGTVRLSRAALALRVDRRNRVRVALTCRPVSGARCSGSLRLAQGRQTHGTRRFSVAAGRRVVTVTLNRAARRALARRGRLRTVISVRGTAGGPGQTADFVRVTLRRPATTRNR
jgi:hypothetical protein